MRSSAVQIDSSIEIVTPENIAFRYSAAGPFRRFPAFLLDLLFRVIIVVAFALAAGIAGLLAGGIALAAILICHFLVEWFYGGFFEAWMNGQTPGKWLMGIRVLAIDGQPITPIQAVLRNVLRFVDMMPLLSLQIVAPQVPMYMIPTFGFCLVAAVLSPRFQRLGDVVCGTMVVIEERRWLTGVAKIDDARVAQLAGYIPLNFRIRRSLARALAAYVDRRRYFSAARRREVAHHLAEPLLAQFRLSPDTSYDLLLCALYYRAFISDRSDDDVSLGRVESPFGQPMGAAEFSGTPLKLRPVESSLSNAAAETGPTP